MSEQLFEDLQLTQAEDEAMKNSKKVITVIIQILNLMFNYNQGNSAFLYGRKKTEASYINNKFEQLFLAKQNNKELNIEGLLYDVNAITAVINHPIYVAEHVLPNFKYRGIPIFSIMDSRRKNMIDEYDSNGNFIKRSKNNGYQAYHLTLTINPEFLEAIVDDTIHRLDDEDKDFSDFEILLQDIIINEFDIINSTSNEIAKNKIKESLNFFAELQLKTQEMLYESEYGMSAHDGYKKGKLNGIFKEMLSNNETEGVYKKFKFFILIEDKASNEYKAYQILKKYDDEQDIENELLDLFAHDSDALENFLDEYREILGVKSKNYMALKKAVITNTLENRQENFYENLRQYAAAVQVDLDELVGMTMEEIIEKYNIPVTPDMTLDLAYIRVLKQMTFIKEISLYLRTSKTSEDAIKSLKGLINKRKKNSKIALERFCDMLGIRPEIPTKIIEILGVSTPSPSEKEKLEKYISTLREKSQATFYYFNGEMKEGAKCDVPIIKVINAMENARKREIYFEKKPTKTKGGGN